MENISEMPIYNDVGEHSAIDKLFGDDVMKSTEESIEQSHGFMLKIAELCKENKVSAIFLLDKSARPLKQIIQKTFNKYVQDSEVKLPNILFINVGQNLVYQKPNFEDHFNNEDPIGFSGKVDSIREAYKKWVEPNSTVIVVDEYSSTGKSLANASNFIETAFKDDAVKVKPLVAFSKIPRWYSREDYLGIKEADYAFYERKAKEATDKKLGEGDDYFKEYYDEDGNALKEVPDDVRQKRLRYFKQYGSFKSELKSENDDFLLGNIPTASRLGETRTDQEIKDKVPRKSTAARGEINKILVNVLLGK